MCENLGDHLIGNVYCKVSIWLVLGDFDLIRCVKDIENPNFGLRTECTRLCIKYGFKILR